MPASNSHFVLWFSDRCQPQAVYFFCFLLDLLQPRLLAKKTRNLRAELWSEHFLIYSRLRQMNIESLFVLCANISSISISTEKLRERTALISPLNFSDLSDTLILAPFVFFSSRDHALHVDLLSFIRDVEPTARWLRLRREGIYFRWTFGKFWLLTHAKWWLRQILSIGKYWLRSIRI